MFTKVQLGVEFDRYIVSFNVFDAIKVLEKHIYLCSIEMHGDIYENVDKNNNEIVMPSIDFNFDKLNGDEISFSLQKWGIELKVLPPHLKYMFLEENNMLYEILSKKLTPIREKELILVLNKNKKN